MSSLLLRDKPCKLVLGKSCFNSIQPKYKLLRQDACFPFPFVAPWAPSSLLGTQGQPIKYLFSVCITDFILSPKELRKDLAIRIQHTWIRRYLKGIPLAFWSKRVIDHRQPFDLVPSHFRLTFLNIWQPPSLFQRFLYITWKYWCLGLHSHPKKGHLSGQTSLFIIEKSLN